MNIINLEVLDLMDLPERKFKDWKLRRIAKSGTNLLILKNTGITNPLFYSVTGRFWRPNNTDFDLILSRGSGCGWLAARQKEKKSPPPPPPARRFSFHRCDLSIQDHQSEKEFFGDSGRWNIKKKFYCGQHFKKKTFLRVFFTTIGKWWYGERGFLRRSDNLIVTIFRVKRFIMKTKLSVINCSCQMFGNVQLVARDFFKNIFSSN